MIERNARSEANVRIIFVRHGEPNYELDCLTEKGHRQAEACAKRLEHEGISEIFASPMGRAAQTADYTAKLLGLPVETLDYMHEISWGGEGIPEKAHPWTLAERMIAQDDYDFYHDEWREHLYFKTNDVMKYVNGISEQFDALLLREGYRHEGTRFFCETDEPKNIAVFSHGGSGACIFSHLLALPFPYVCTVMPCGHTSITILNFPVRKGEFVHPRLELFNDTLHTVGVATDLVIQQEST